jgi:hypothetical protein
LYTKDIDNAIHNITVTPPNNTSLSAWWGGSSNKVLLLGRWRKIVTIKKSKYVHIKGQLVKLKDAIKLNNKVKRLRK